MSQPVRAGTRIRNRRTALGLRQSDLARTCDISPSYLNLIEHNRRRIGGALLLRIAEALDTDPAILSEGAEAALTSALDAAASAHVDIPAERDQLEEMAGRFPGWARLIEAQFSETRRLEQVVERLDDRLTHDPFLSASMHNVLTHVTAIRSASAILASGEQVEPEWQARFHRNIFEDSQRLTDATETLVGYLDTDDDTDDTGTLPADDVENWFASRGWRIEELENNTPPEPETIEQAVQELPTSAARVLAKQHLDRYAADAALLPDDRLSAALAEGPDPKILAARLNLPLPVIFRRLASLGNSALENGGSFGLVGCDASGTIIFRKSIPGFEPPRYGGACPLWPLFRALQQPMILLSEALRFSGRDTTVFDAHAISEVAYPSGYDRPPALTAWMLVSEMGRGETTSNATPAGISCRVCAEPNCPTRREPSVFAAVSNASL